APSPKIWNCSRNSFETISMILFMTIGDVVGFLDLVFFCIVCVFFLRNLEKLSFYLKSQYPDTWISLGSVRLSGSTVNSPEGSWYAWINYRPLYRFLRFQHLKLSDEEVEKLVWSIKKNGLLFLIVLVVLIFRIKYL
ncbi:MAG: hypothetical protein AAB968_01660, partial [Patescibacteria group bacterium]